MAKTLEEYSNQKETHNTESLESKVELSTAEREVESIFSSKTKLIIKKVWIPLIIVLVIVTTLIIAFTPIVQRNLFLNNLTLISDKLQSVRNVPSNLQLSTHESPLQELANGTIVQRQEILNVYESVTEDTYSKTFRELHEIEWIIDEVLLIIENNSDWKMKNTITPNDMNLNLTYNFSLARGNFVVIEKTDGSLHSLYKIRVKDDRITYSNTSYYILTDAVTTYTLSDFNYRYSYFDEGNEEFFITHQPNKEILNYHSFIDDFHFTITHGNNVIDEDRQKVGYTMDWKDTENNVITFLRVVDDIIKSETYDVFDGVHSMYQYQDRDLTDNLISLNINFVTATGWDYFYSNQSEDAQSGIYLDGGEALYQGHINYNSLYGNAFFKQDIAKDTFSNTTFQLSDFGMNLSNDFATIEYFNSIKVNDLESVKQVFTLNGINFFDENINYKLYAFIDSDFLPKVSNPTNN